MAAADGDVDSESSVMTWAPTGRLGYAHAVVAGLLAALVGGFAAADAASGHGTGTGTAVATVLILTAAATIASVLAVLRLPSALVFAGTFAALAWAIALVIDTQRWWAAPAGGLGVVALLVVASPRERWIDETIARRVGADRAAAFGMAVVGAGMAAAMVGSIGAATVLVGVSVAVGSLLVLVVVFTRLFRRVLS